MSVINPSGAGEAAPVLAPAAAGRNVISPTDPAVVPLIEKGAAGQTADLEQWQSSAAAVLSSVAANGGVDLATTLAGRLRASAAGTGLNGNAPVAKAAAIAAPTVPGGLYNSAEAQSAVDAINAIRAALAAIGITA